MADVSAVPFINFNEPGLTAAQTGLTQAQTGVAQQQAQQQAMNTQIQRATMPLIMRSIQEASADQSGANPGNPEIAATEQARADQSGVSPSDFYGVNQAGMLEDALRRQNYIQPYTQQELQMLKYGTALSMNPNTAAGGKAIVDRMQTQRQARIDNQTAANQLSMGDTYDAAAAVATKGEGAFRALLAVDPADARAINPAAARGDIAPSADDDAKATKYAQHLAAVSHLYSGRPTKMENGQLYDERTGQAVVGRDQLFTGLNADQRQKEFDRATEQIEWTTPDNVIHKDERWKAPVEYGGYGGKLTPAQAVLAADQAARHAPDGSATASPGIIPNAAAGSGAAPPVHGAVAAARASARANTRVRTNGADIAAGSAPATSADQGTLANPASFTKTVSPVVGQGPGSAGTAGTKLLEGVANRQNEAITSANTAYTDAQTMRSQITQAKAEMTKIDPRTVGPGSSIYNTMLRAYTAAAGSAPNALIDETVLDKFLNQIGASNVRNLLAGQRITNQEMMTFLTRGSPSTAMPLGGIQHLINYLEADNEYTLRYNRTKTMALKSGADPDLIDQELSNRVTRSAFVARRTGNGDTLSQSAGSSKTGDYVETREYQGKKYGLRRGADRNSQASWDVINGGG